VREDVAALEQMNVDFAAAINAGDAARAAGLYTVDEVIMLSNGEPVRRREQIQAFWQAEIDAGLTDVSVGSFAAARERSLGYEAGTYKLSVKPEYGPVITGYGKYLEILRIEDDGVWRSSFGIWNSSVAPAAE
jgi:ketosteroid isomerase-like protein